MLAVLLAILPSLRSLLLLTSSPHLRLLVIPIQRPYPNRRVSRVSRHVSTLSEHMPQHVRRNFGGTSARIDVITSVVMHAMAEINSQLRMPRRPDLRHFASPFRLHRLLTSLCFLTHGAFTLTSVSRSSHGQLERHKRLCW